MNRSLLVAVVLMLACTPLLDLSNCGIPVHDEHGADPEIAGVLAPPAPDLEELRFSMDGTFWENAGQLDDGSVRLYANGPAITVGFSTGRVVILPHEGTEGKPISMEFVGGDAVGPRGEGPLGFPVNVFDGGSREATVVRGFKAVRYEGVQDGLDVVFRMDRGALKYDVLVAPGADPCEMAIRYVGVDSVAPDGSTGDLRIKAGRTVLTDAAPVAYQYKPQGRVDVDARFLVDGDRVSFDVGSYDHALPLVIDPVLEYSTYVGSDSGDYADSLMLGTDGYLYLTGVSYGSGFPVTDGHTPGSYVMKVDPSDKSIEFCSIILTEEVDDSCMDASGAYYLTGRIHSLTNKPFLTDGAFCTTYNGGASDIFVVKVAPNGTYVEYGTTLGGRDRDSPNAIAVDSTGCVYLGGMTGSDNFPTTPDALTGKFSTGNWQGFLTKLSANGSALEYSSKYFMGARTLAVDDEDMVYISGPYNDDYPPTSGAYNTTYKVYQLVKVQSDLTTVEFSTCFERDIADIAIDDAGDIFLTGFAADDIKTTDNAFQKEPNGGDDSYVSELDPTGSKLLYSTYIGGSEDELPRSILVDGDGNVLLVGDTISDDFPVSRGAYNTSYGGGKDGFVLKLSPGEANLTYSSYLGGSDNDVVEDIVVMGDGTVVVWGYTESDDYPTTAGARDTTYDGYGDSFLTFVGELVPPKLLDDATRSSVGTGETLRFRVNVTDNDAVENVSVEYWFDDPNKSVNQTLSLASGSYQEGTWEHNLTIDPDSPTLLTYRMTAFDRIGTMDVGPVRVVSILDRTRPMFEARPLPQGTTGDPYNLSVVVRDNRGMGGVHAVYWFGDDPSAAVNATMTGLELDALGRGTYFLDGIQVPANATDPLWYHFAASDAAGNWNATSPLSISIVDNDPPALLEDLSDATATTGDEFVFKVTVDDNIAIFDVKVFYRFGTGALEGMSLAEVVANQRYSGFVQVPPEFQGDLVYLFRITDTSTLTYIGAEVSRHVLDNDPPELLEDLSDAQATTGDDFTFTARVRDNIGIGTVKANYKFGAGSIEGRLLEAVEANSTYAGTITIPEDFTGPFVYWLSVSDTGGLRVSADNVTLTITDNDPPTVVMDLTEGTPTSGVEFTIRVEVSDNIGVAGVELHYALGERTPAQTAMAHGAAPGEFTANVDVPLDFWGTLTYAFLVTDSAGNSFESDDHAIEVVDGLLPWLGQDRSDTAALKGTAFHLEVVAGDNVALQGVSAAIYVGGTLVDTLSMALDAGAYVTTYTVPRDSTGTLGYSFTALDAGGNSNSTRVVELPITNAPPALDITEWTVVEGVQSALDLAPHLSDANDDVAGLTVSLTDPDISVDGKTLRVLYDAWRPDHVVRVTVSDGEDSVTVDITVKVTNVNDAPVIKSVAPGPGPEYKEGEEVQFSATAEDEDGDALTYVWKLAGAVIHEGREFAYKDLKPGTHTVTLEVSDGNATVTQDVVVVVKKREKGSPGPSAALTMLATAAVAGALLWTRSRRARDWGGPEE